MTKSGRKYNLKLVFCSVAAFSFSIVGAVSSNAETLEEALISAYQSNPKLQAERARLREIDETYVQTRAQERLTANLSGNINLNATRTPSLSIPVPGFDSFITSGTDVSTPAGGQLQIIQPIYQGGRVRALKAQAKAGILASRERLRGIETDVFVNVANAYVDVLRDEEASRIRRANLRLLMRQKEAADSRFELGAGTRTDVAQAEARLAGAKVGLAQADAQLQISRANYRQWTGHIPANLQALPVFTLPTTEAEAASLARANNPQILASVFQQEAGDAAIDAAKAAKKPVISLNATAGGQRWNSGFPSSSEQATIGAQVTVPLTTGGLNRSKIRAAENARTRLMFETRDAERQMDASIMQSWAALQAAEEALSASRVQVSAAELALEGVELEREVGTRTALDVLNAEQEVLEARLGVINSRSEVAKAGYSLLALTGAFDALALSLPTDIYHPEQNFNDVTNDNLGIVDNIFPEKWR